MDQNGFAFITPDAQDIPFTGSTAANNALGLTNPDSVLSGTLRGNQNVGSANLNIDSTNNVISVKGINTLANSVVKYGEIDANHLGFAVNDGTNDIMFAGQDSTTTPTSTYIKIAKPGFDAKVAGATNLVFNSQQDVFKIVTSGTYHDPTLNYSTTTPAAGNFASDEFSVATIPHNLGYTPALISFLQAGPTYVPLPYSQYLTFIASTAAWFTYSATVDITNVYITLNSMVYGTSYGLGGQNNFKYYLLQETAN